MAKWQHMKRLTPGPDCPWRDKIVYSEDEQVNEICKAHQNLEDLEEDFCGVNEFLSFNILYWAMIDGICYLNGDSRDYDQGKEYADNDWRVTRCKHVVLDLKHSKLLGIEDDRIMEFDFKDYGEVWALVPSVLMPNIGKTN